MKKRSFRKCAHRRPQRRRHAAPRRRAAAAAARLRLCSRSLLACRFTFRGVDLDQLLDLTTDELVQLFHARARRR